VAPLRIQFGDFVLDCGTRQLRRGEELCPLGPKAFELLELLLAHRPNVVTKKRVRDRLWPSTAVSDSTLATVVLEVRSALRDDAKNPAFLRTVHGVGYAFCGDALHAGHSEEGAATAYRLFVEGREVALHPGENLLGRVETGAVWIESPSVSRRHARILIEEGLPILEDLGSKNGTYLRGERIQAPTRLSDGDEFRLGRVRVQLRAVQVDDTTHTDGG
jgi:DNA-binding winged helix-turn-helix (wHTH) protein